MCILYWTYIGESAYVWQIASAQTTMIIMPFITAAAKEVQYKHVMNKILQNHNNASSPLALALEDFYGHETQPTMMRTISLRLIWWISNHWRHWSTLWPKRCHQNDLKGDSIATPQSRFLFTTGIGRKTQLTVNHPWWLPPSFRLMSIDMTCHVTALLDTLHILTSQSVHIGIGMGRTKSLSETFK